MDSAPSPMSHPHRKPTNGRRIPPATDNFAATDIASPNGQAPLANEHDSATEVQADDNTTSEVHESTVFHRIGEVRRQQGVSVRCAARQLGTDVASVRRQEQPSSDLTLSELYAWQGILEVPVYDLLMDPEMPLSRPVMERARLVRLMKTTAAILEDSKSSSVQLLAERMIDQLIEIMPELKDVGAWHTVGQRRSLDEFGRVFEQRISEDMLYHYRDGHQE